MEKNVLKWQGGKSSLFYGPIKQFLPIELFNPASNITFIDAFAGGGSDFLYVLYNCPGVKRLIINDFNKKLIKLYYDIKYNIELLLIRLDELQSSYNSSTDKEAYFKWARKVYNSTVPSIETSALLMLINRTCFNGIYRENSKGLFNVPWGKKDSVTIYTENSLREISNKLNSIDVILTHGDYSGVEFHVTPGSTFIYLDPPYRPLSGSNSFVSYTSSPFNDNSQVELKLFCDRMLMDYGAKVMVSNSFDPNDNFLLNLYSGYNIDQISATRSSGGKGAKRGSILENLIRNY